MLLLWPVSKNEREREKKERQSLTERWRLVIDVNEMYQGTDICSARSGTYQARNANLIVPVKVT